MTSDTPPPPPPAARATPVGWERLETETLEVQLDYDPHVNYAMQQNAVPVVKALRVRNGADVPLEDVTISVWAAPELAPRVSFAVAEIPAGSAFRLETPDVAFAPTRLVNKEERERAQLFVEVATGEDVLHRVGHPIDVLAYSEWAGTSSLPEILAAFVLPNHPEVEALLSRACVHLETKTGDPSLSGYGPSQTARGGRDPERVRQIVAAIWDAAAERDLAYVTPPASFESSGQKIRTPDRIVASGLGTCLDLVLFLAAACEQAGLNPLLILQDEHALLGVWTEPESFSHATIDQGLRIQKRVELDTLLVVESTGLTSRPVMSFEMAWAVAVKRVADLSVFAYAIDVAAARRAGIRPLPGRATGARYVPVEPVDDPVTVSDVVPPAPVPEPTPEVPTGPARIERWKRKLLDLTLRNRLLNFRPTKRSLPLLVPDVTRLEDLLAEGRSFRVKAKSDVMGDADPRSAALHIEQTAVDAEVAYLEGELSEGRLHADLEADELEKRLVTIDRAARQSLEEGGANTLYLALGFLHWFETPSAEKERTAPILLLPLELSRAGVREGYQLTLADEDAQINVTLLQKLEADYDIPIDGLDRLATDDAGLDVQAILRTVREAILPVERWHVEDEAVVGLFSFTKHLMWRDLADRAGDLARNDVVRHLVSHARAPYPAEPLPPLDLDRPAAGTFCPLDSDSSQLRAIHAGADGHTFVLEGPPGTGKSQTIANLIAHALGTGQRVLFVSEKMAALNVVKKRLDRVGLGPFCLELHSNKAQKRRVLAQLGEALDFVASGDPVGFEEAAADLDVLRGELRAYVDCLHTKRSFGVSLFDGLCTSIENEGASEVPFPLDGPDGVDAETMAAWRSAVHTMGVALADVVVPDAHPLHGVGLEAWTPRLADETKRVGAALEAAAQELDRDARAFAATLGMPERAFSQDELKDIDRLGGLIEVAPAPPAALVTATDFESRRQDVQRWIGTGQAYVQTRDEVLGTYREAVFDLNLGDVRTRLAQARDGAWLLRWWRARKPRSQLAALRSGRLDPLDTLVGQMDRAIQADDHAQQIKALGAEAGDLLAHHWRGRDTDWDGVAQVVTWVGEVRVLVRRLSGDEAALRMDWFAEGSVARRAFDTYRVTRETFAAARTDAVARLVLDEDVIFGASDAPALAERAEARAVAWQEGTSRLRGWCAWRRARSAARTAGLGPIVEATETGRAGDDPAACFERSFHAAWVDAVYGAEPLLSGFNAAEQDDRVARFRELDVRVRDLASAAVRARLAERLPTSPSALSSSSTSEVGLLQRERKKQRRHISIRSLFRRIPHLLSRLKPCMLMSPLSVAQYLGPDFPAFDLVVFDEASQIPTWDAVGAIARGTKLIVVGDSKQLPPTTFFMRLDDEDVDEDDIEEVESILDECVAVSMPRLRLAWHYRSRHEHLIAFSNHHYYDGDLFTFPAADSGAASLGVAWRPVPDGIYDKSRTRTNRAEAEAVVAEVVRRLSDPDEQDRSIGIVTFSLAQQTLIQDLLDQARREHEGIERFFTDAVGESVFVKNLENVQGDERDVILFSVCYGPDENGRIAMNFGPLNRSGGERRLNVAVTRAREQVQVFSTLTADQIDLARTSSVGVAHLKAFLAYAEQGPSVLDQALAPETPGAKPTAIERGIRVALEAAGAATDPRVGCSGYRVDVGVQDPVDAGRFLLGVETDGPMYASGETARDRDRTRSSVLGSLGWHLERVWLTEWWQDPEREVSRILARVREVAGAAQADESEEIGVQAFEPDEGPPETPPVPPRQRDRSPYRLTKHSGRLGTPDAFHASRSDPRLDRVIEEILEQEAPIAQTWLVRRVAERFGLERLTERAEERVIGRLMNVPHTREWQDDVEILWAAGQDPAAYDGFRVPTGDEATKRAVEDLPYVEIENAALAVLRGHVSMPATDLARETARVLGHARLGSSVKRSMDAGIQRLVQHKRARRDGNVIVLP